MANKINQVRPTLVSRAWQQWPGDLQKCTVICNILLQDQKNIVRNRWRFCFCMLNIEIARLITVHSICSILSFNTSILQANEIRFVKLQIQSKTMPIFKQVSKKSKGYNVVRYGSLFCCINIMKFASVLIFWSRVQPGKNWRPYQS